MPDPSRGGSGREATQSLLQGIARYILEERDRRRWHFPRAVFGEIPWEMLLLLYASEPRPLSKAGLENAMMVAPAVVDRWIDYLEREGLLERLPALGGPPAAKLTRSGLSSLELYLFDRLVRADAHQSGGREKQPEGLPGWVVGLLMLGTSILSAMAAWSLAA